MQKAHLALIDALMTLAAKETVGRVKMAAEAEQMGVGAPWENALLFWVNRVREQKSHCLCFIFSLLCCSSDCLGLPQKTGRTVFDQHMVCVDEAQRTSFFKRSMVAEKLLK